MVRRVNINEIATSWFIQRVSEILCYQMNAFQCPNCRQNIFPVVKAWICLRANGYVEFAGGIHAPEAVEAGLVEKNHAGGAFHHIGTRQVVAAADEIVVTLAVGPEFREVFIE